MPLVLDTHVLVWLTEPDGKLSAEVETEIDQQARNDGAYVSPITFWEVAMLTAGNRLQLETPLDQWFRRTLDAPGLDVAPLTPEIALASTRLPGGFHKDPADRFIVATARALDATLVTHDRTILRYADQGHVRVLAV